MGDKRSGHNDIFSTKLNSIHHKVVIDTNRVERIDSTDYNTSCNCEMRWDGAGYGADVGDDVDDDLDDACDDDDDKGDDLPFREVISLAESARQRWLFLLCRFPLRGGGETRKIFYIQGFHPRGSYRREGVPRGATRHPEGFLVGPLDPIFGVLQSSFIKV